MIDERAAERMFGWKRKYERYMQDPSAWYEVPEADFRSDLDLGRREEVLRVMNVDGELFDLLAQAEEERRCTYQSIKVEHDLRKALNPEATEFELGIGCYLEDIEPQMREAVIKMNGKGYSTTASGYHGRAWIQSLSWVIEEGEPDFSFAVDQLMSEGFEVIDEKHAIHGFDHHALVLRRIPPLRREEWTRVWTRFAESMPSLGKPARPSPLPIARRFRESQASTLFADLMDNG